MPETDPFKIIDTAGTPSLTPTPSLTTGEVKQPKASDPFAFIDSGGAPGDSLAATTRVGLVQDPARAARVLKLRDSIAMPSDFIDRNLDQVEQEVRTQGFDPVRFRKESPLVATWLEQAPEYAAVSRDDLGRLAAVEKFVADSPDYKFLPNGQIQGPSYNKGTLADTFDTLSLLRKFQRDETNGFLDNLERQQRVQEIKDRFGPAANIVAGMAQSLASTQRALGTGTRDTQNAVADLGMASSDLSPGLWGDIQRGVGGVIADAPLMIAGGAFVQAGKSLAGIAKLGKFGTATVTTAAVVQPLAIREGLDTGRESGWTNGLASWGIETVVPAAFGTTGTEKVIANLTKRGVSQEVARGFIPASLALLKDVGLEATEESVTELAHAMHESISGINPDALEPDQLWRRMAAAGAVGGVVSGALNAPSAILRIGKEPGRNFNQTVDRMQAAFNGEALVQQLTVAATESETAKRYEPGAKTLFQSLTANKVEQVYVDRDAWEQIATKAGLDPRTAAIELLGGPAQQAGEALDPKRTRSLEQAAKSYDEAARTGTPLSIPTADLAFYLARKTDIATAITKEVRLDPQAMNVREAEALIQSQETVEGQAAQATPQEEAAAIQGEIEQQLTAQGYDAGSAKRSATQMASVFRTQAARFNAGKTAEDATRITPKQLWDEWNVVINRPTADVLSKPTRTTIDQAFAGVDAARADAKLEKFDAERQDAQTTERQALLDRAAGKAGEDIIAEARAAIKADELSRKAGFDTATVILGRDFGFATHDTAAQSLTPAQRDRGALLILAMKMRGVKLSDLVAEAGGGANPIAATAKPQAETITAEQEQVEKMAFQLKDIGTMLRDTRQARALTDAEYLTLLEQATELAQVVEPRFDEIAKSWGEPLRAQVDALRDALEVVKQGGNTLDRGGDVAYISADDRSGDNLLGESGPSGANRAEARGRSSAPLPGDVPGQQSFLTPDGQIERDFARGETGPASDSRLVSIINGWGGSIQPGDSIGTLIAGIVNDRAAPVAVLRGATINSPRDAALLLAAYRSPYMERSTWLLVRDGQVVHNGLWAVGGIDFAEMPTPEETDKLLDDIGARTGDTMVWSHNHPSGDPTPSTADDAVYNRLRLHLSDSQISFSGLVLNGDHFVEWKSHGQSEKTAYDGGKSFFVTEPGVQVRTPSAIAGWAKSLQLAPGTVLLVHVSPRLNIVGVEAFQSQPDAATIVASRNAVAAAKTFVVGVSKHIDVAAIKDARVLDVVELTDSNITISHIHQGTYKSVTDTENGDVVNIVRQPSEFEQNKNARRGSITFGDTPEGRRTTIRIFQAADLSTFLHESGHLYLELLGELAKRPGAPAQIVDDYAQALAHIGATPGKAITTEQHETWARSWEAYLMEGKAPSAELRPVFARFAAWLSSVYRSIKNLAVQLSPEVRGVMDRLIATEDEIDSASKSLGDDGFQAHATALGLTPEQAATIAKADQDAMDQAHADMQAQAMAEITREQTAHWRELRAEVRAEVELETNRQPLYVAASVLRRGELPGGVPLPPDRPAVKLDSAAVTHRVEQLFATKPERIAAMKRLTMMHTKTRGVSLDQAAEAFGFESGDALLRALLTMRPRAELIEAETDVRMRERFGDILTDGTIAEKAMESLHTERRGDVHMAKVRALGTRVGKKVAPVEVMRAAAEAKIAGTAAGDILPHLFLRAEVKAREEVQRHLAKQDWESALAAKQRELLNHEMYRAAVQARKDVEKALEYARKFDEPKTQERIGKAGGWEWTVTASDGAAFQFPSEDAARQASERLPGSTWERTSGYLEQINALRERYMLRKGTNKEAARRQSLAAWVAQQMAQGVPINLSPELLNEARRINWRKVTVSELLGLQDGLSHIAYLARKKNELSRLQRQRELEALARTLVATLQRTKPNPKPADAEDGRGNKAVELTADFWAMHRKAASFLREMDGHQDGGPFVEALLHGLNEAADTEATTLWEAKQRQDAMWKTWSDAIASTDWQPNERHEFDGFRGGLTRMGAVMVALNWGNDGNRARLMDGNKVDEAQVHAVLDSLDAADWNLVEAVWEHIDSYWSEIKALEQRVTGVAPEKVDPAPFRTKHGTIRGGYFPIIYNKESAALRIDGDSTEWAKQMAAQAYGRAVTRHGHTQARAMGLGQPLSLDPNVIGKHLSQVVHDLTHREALGDAARILADDSVAQAISLHMGPRALRQLKSWLGDIATGGRPATPGSRFLGFLRRGFSMASMGFRPMTAALQLTGFSNAAQRVGPGRMAYAIRQLFDKPDGFASNFALVESRSQMMAARSRTQTHDLTEIMSGMRRDRLGQSQEAIAKYGFWMMQRTQRVVDTATWLASYAKAQEEGQSEPEAIKVADQTVLDTQGGGQVKDLSGAQRDSFLQVFTGAYTYGAMMFNQLHDVAGSASARYRSGDKAGAFAQGMTGLFFAAALPAAMTLALRSLLRGTPEHEKDSIAKRYGIELLSSIMGTMIGARELTGTIQGFGYEGPATTKTIGAYGNLLVQIGQGDIDKGLARAVNDSIGGTFGLPSGQIWATATGFMDMLDRNTPDPRPLLFGPPPKH